MLKLDNKVPVEGKTYREHQKGIQTFLCYNVPVNFFNFVGHNGTYTDYKSRNLSN